MRFAFLDESGDLGLRRLGQDPGTTDYFVVALILVDDPVPVHASIDLLKARFGMRSAEEFKFSATSKERREAFLMELRRHDIAIRAMVVNKALVVDRPETAGQALFSTDVIRRAMVRHREALNETTLVIDEYVRGKRAQPFAVENVGFYAGGREWKDLWAEQPAARVYRDAMVELYGGTAVEGYAHLHGRKGNRWVHVGPIDAPIAAAQVDAILAGAAGTDLHAVDILSADIPIDWNKSEAEVRHGVVANAKMIPADAVAAVRDRLGRKRRKDPALEDGPAIHFFSPPDVEVGVSVAGDGVTVKLLRLTVDLDDCLSTQDAAKRAEIKGRITDWRALVDYWAVDWDYHPEWPFQNDWQSFRTRKQREIAMQAAYTYGSERGEKLVAVKVTDIFGNDGLKVARVVVG